VSASQCRGPGMCFPDRIIDAVLSLSPVAAMISWRLAVASCGRIFFRQRLARCVGVWVCAAPLLEFGACGGDCAAALAPHLPRLGGHHLPARRAARVPRTVGRTTTVNAHRRSDVSRAPPEAGQLPRRALSCWASGDMSSSPFSAAGRSRQAPLLVSGARLGCDLWCRRCQQVRLWKGSRLRVSPSISRRIS